MIRSLFVSMLSILSLYATAQVTVRCELEACVEGPSVFEFDGSTFFPVRQPSKVQEGIYEFELPESANRFYYVGVNTTNLTAIILGQEAQVTVKGHCGNFRSALIESPVNEAYQSLKQKLNGLQSRSSVLNRKYQMAAGESQEKIGAELKALDEERLALLDAMEKEDPLLGKVAAVNTSATRTMVAVTRMRSTTMPMSSFTLSTLKTLFTNTCPGLSRASAITLRPSSAQACRKRNSAPTSTAPWQSWKKAASLINWPCLASSPR